MLFLLQKDQGVLLVKDDELRGQALEPDPRPLADVVGGLDHVHASGAELLQLLGGFVGVVDHDVAARIAYHHRGHAVLEDVDAIGHARIHAHDLVAEVGQEPGDAVRACLTSHDQAAVRRAQGFEEGGVDLRIRERLAIPARHHLGAENAVVLAERVITLELVPGLAPAGVVVEEAGLLEHAHQSVTGVAQDAVRRPDVESVLALTSQLIAVVDDLLFEPGNVAAAQPPGDLGVGLEPLDEGAVREDVGQPPVLDRHHGVDLGGEVIFADEEHRAEDLVGQVGVEGTADVADHAHPLVEELADAHDVVGGAPAGPAGHVQGAVRVAEVALEVHAHEVDVRGAAVTTALEAVALGPVEGRRHQLGQVGIEAPGLGVGRVEVRRKLLDGSSVVGTHGVSPWGISVWF